MNMEKIREVLKPQKASKSKISLNYQVVEAPKLLLSLLRAYKLKVSLYKGKNTDTLFIKVSGKKYIIIKVFNLYNEKIQAELTHGEKKLLEQLKAYKTNTTSFNKYDFTYEASDIEYGGYDMFSNHITHIEDFLQFKKTSDMEYMPKRLNYGGTTKKRRKTDVLLDGAEIILRKRVIDGREVIPKINLSNGHIKLKKLSNELNLSLSEFIEGCCIYATHSVFMDWKQRSTARAILRQKLSMPNKDIKRLISSFWG